MAQSDFFGFSHYQQDETSFILNKDGNELIIDPGLYSYAQSPVYTYYRAAAFDFEHPPEKILLS